MDNMSQPIVFSKAALSSKDIFPKSECLQSRKILTLLDFPEEAKNYKVFERHVNRCLDCQNQLIAARHYVRIADEAIPMFRPDEKGAEALSIELHDILSKIDFKSSEYTFIQKDKKLRQFEKGIEGALDILISWRMIPAYVLAVALMVVLSKF